MRKTQLALLSLAAVALLATGCSRQRTYVVPGGKATVTEKGGKAKTIEVETNGGKATIQTEKKTISEAELGVPVYPGAIVEVSGNYEGGAAGSAEKMQQTTLTTPDGFDKVFEFYKKNLKNPENTMSQNMGTGQMGMFSLKSADGSQIVLHIPTSKDKAGTTIQVMKMAKPKQ